jgi:hypothetical protein
MFQVKMAFLNVLPMAIINQYQNLENIIEKHSFDENSWTQ